MHQSILKLEAITGNTSMFRTIIKTRHGRVLFLSLEINGPTCSVQECFYIDRNQGRVGVARYNAKPKKLRTLEFPTADLLTVIKNELDKEFYGVEFVNTDHAKLSLEEYLQLQTEKQQKKYRFLVMVGEGKCANGLPMLLRTRLKTKLHRSVYVELAYYKDGKGVVSQCYYYDREYRRQGIKITPPMLISCFFPYTKAGILDLLNHEICCDFTHMLVTEGLDLDSNPAPLCGAI